MVFSPFFRKGCLNAAPPRIPLGKADTKNLVKAENSKQLNEIEILPKISGMKNFQINGISVKLPLTKNYLISLKTA